MPSIKTFIPVLLLPALLLFSWIPKKEINDYRKNNITLNYTRLMLTKNQYNSLKSKKVNTDFTDNDRSDKDKFVDLFRRKNAIIFQFAYTSELYPYPTLRAYPMKYPRLQMSFGTPLYLEYLDSKPLPFLSSCGEQVTGDLQITFDDIEALKAESNPKDSENYEYFIFTPKYDTLNQHIFFEIKVFPSTSPDLITKTRNTNPSPPYGAN